MFTIQHALCAQKSACIFLVLNFQFEDLVMNLYVFGSRQEIFRSQWRSLPQHFLESPDFQTKQELHRLQFKTERKDRPKVFGVELKFVELRADASKQTVKKFERNPEWGSHLPRPSVLISWLIKRFTQRYAALERWVRIVTSYKVDPENWGWR